MEAITSRLLAALAYPRVLDDFVELANPLRARRELRARIVETRRETHDVVTLVLETARPFRHRAGQWTTLGVTIDGVRHTRCFSIASAENATRLELTIKALPDGLVTPRIVAGTLDEPLVTLGKAQGDFTMPGEDGQEWPLFVSGGSGITPVMSMLRTLVGTGAADGVTFVHFARSKEDVIFAAELEHLARDLDIRVHVGRFDAGALPEGFLDRPTYACGPAPFLAAMEDAYAGARGNLHTERFALEAPSSSTSGNVFFRRSGRRADGRGPLLGIAERAGLVPASGCRMGICHSCACRKVSGTTRDVRTGELSTESDVDIRICVSEPVGPVELDI